MTFESATPAGLVRRLAAICYDTLLVVALLMVVTGLAIAIRGGRAIAPGSLWFQGLVLAAWWLYFGWSWTHGGQTVGMRAWRIKALAANGDPIDWTRATRRFFAALLAWLPLGLGFLWGLVDSEKRCWHDRLSDTRLLYLGPRKPRDA